MTTLCELLDGLHYESWSDGDLADVVREHLKVWAYGEVRECGECEGSGVFGSSKLPCGDCNGTGTKRGPGLVERTEAAAVARARERAGAAALISLSPKDVLVALRAELEEAP